MSHYIKKCRVCEGIMSQYRCPSKDKTIEWSKCADCKVPKLKEPNQTDKNRFLAERMQLKYGYDFDDTTYVDYFTAEGRQELLQFCVEQEWWNRRGYENQGFKQANAHLDGMDTFVERLFIPVGAFAEAVYQYLKEQDNV